MLVVHVLLHEAYQCNTKTSTGYSYMFSLTVEESFRHSLIILSASVLYTLNVDSNKMSISDWRVRFIMIVDLIDSWNIYCDVYFCHYHAPPFKILAFSSEICERAAQAFVDESWNQPTEPDDTHAASFTSTVTIVSSTWGVINRIVWRVFGVPSEVASGD